MAANKPILKFRNCGYLRKFRLDSPLIRRLLSVRDAGVRFRVSALSHFGGLRHLAPCMTESALAEPPHGRRALGDDVADEQADDPWLVDAERACGCVNDGTPLESFSRTPTRADADNWSAATVLARFVDRRVDDLEADRRDIASRGRTSERIVAAADGPRRRRTDR
jgi:hypothetical protein